MYKPLQLSKIHKPTNELKTIYIYNILYFIFIFDTFELCIIFTNVTIKFMQIKYFEPGK